MLAQKSKGEKYRGKAFQAKVNVSKSLEVEDTKANSYSLYQLQGWCPQGWMRWEVGRSQVTVGLRALLIWET